MFIKSVGGKHFACKILDDLFSKYFKNINYSTVVSPFFGGGSFEFYLQNKYKYHIIANDIFYPIYNFWVTCKNHPNELHQELMNTNNVVDKNHFNILFKLIENKEIDGVELASKFFIVNRCSFNGLGMSGTYSNSCAIRNRIPCIQSIKDSNLSNCDFHCLNYDEFINKYHNKNSLLFLDPPYFLGKNSNLYGIKGDLHKNFNHIELFSLLKNKQNWFLTYNNCDYIKELYKDYIMIETDWNYAGHSRSPITRKNKELVIFSVLKE